MMKWITIAETFPVDNQDCCGFLSKLNEELVQKAVLLGDGLKTSIIDIIVFSTLYSFVVYVLHPLLHIVLGIDYNSVPFLSIVH